MEEHRQSESFVNFLESFSSNHTDVFWVYELKSNKIIHVSQSYEQVYGISCIGLMMNPDSFRDVTHPEDVSIVENLIAEQKTGHSLEFEYRIIHPSSMIKWILSKIIPFHLKGKLVWSVVSSKDITKKKRPRNSSYESERFLSTILDSTDFILLLDINRKILLANKTVSRNTEIERKNLIGTHVFNIFPPELHEIISINFDKVIHSKCPVEFRTHSGGMLNHYLHPIINSNNEILGVLYCIQGSAAHLFGELCENNEAEPNQSSAEIETIYQAFRFLLTNKRFDELKTTSDFNANNLFALLKQALETNTSRGVERVLSSRELEIASLIKEGKTNKEIAKILNLSVRTVEAHRYNMRDKVGLKNKRKMKLRNQLFFIHSESFESS